MDPEFRCSMRKKYVGQGKVKKLIAYMLYPDFAWHISISS